MTRRVPALSILLAALLLFVPLRQAPAAETTFVKDYVYQASEVDSKVSCRAIAVEQVKRLLLEQVGTFVQSETTVRDFQLTKDEVATLTAGVVSVEILKEDWNGKQYALTARVVVDPKQVAEAIDNLRGNSVDRAELEASRKQNAESLQEIDRLRKDLETMRREAKRSEERLAALQKERKQSDEQARQAREQAEAVRTLEQKYARSTESIELNNLFEAGIALRDAGDFAAALAKFDQLLATDPKNKRAYLGRASTYARMDKLSAALKDIERTLDLDPRFAKAYMVRGKIYRRQGNFSEAVGQQDKALKLNPDFAEAYFERGVSRMKSGEKKEGIEDVKRAANMGLRKAQHFLSDKGIMY